MKRTKEVNKQIETLFSEIKEIENEIEKIKNIDEKENCHSQQQNIEELKQNIRELAKYCIVDYELIIKNTVLQAAINSLIYRICKKPELDRIISELLLLGIPKNILISKKETFRSHLSKFLTEQEVEYYCAFQEFVRIRNSTNYITNPTRKKEFQSDYNWIMSNKSNSYIESCGIDPEVFKEIVKENNEESFTDLVARFNLLLRL